MDNLLLYCGLVDARISASEKDLPVYRANKYKDVIKDCPYKHRSGGFRDNSYTGIKLSDVLIYLSINPKYSIPLLGRFTLIIHQNYISRKLVERQIYTDCFA